MDMRSFYINFEVSLMAYSSGCAELYARQKNYIERSETLILNDWNKRPYGQKITENIFRLLGRFYEKIMDLKLQTFNCFGPAYAPRLVYRTKLLC